MNQSKYQTQPPQIHAMMIVSGVSSTLRTKEQNSNLRGTLTDKINVENFCYNYQDYFLHPTVQFSEDDAGKVKRPLHILSQYERSHQLASKELKEDSDDPTLQNELENQEKKMFIEARQNFRRRESTVEQVIHNRFSLNDPEIFFDVNNQKEKIKIHDNIRIKAMKKLRQFFDRNENEHCLLFLSGHGLSNARFVLNDKVKAYLTLAEIIMIWDSKPKSEWKVLDAYGSPKICRNHLLIVIDACNSGSFTQLIQRDLRRPLGDVSIQTSSSLNEKSYDDIEGAGGFFLNNLLYVNGLKDIRYNYTYRRYDPEDQKRRDLQRPTFYSKFSDLEQTYRLRIGFNRWEELEWRVSQSFSGTFIADNGDILKGQFKSVQLHGKGEKRLISGRVEKGNFKNDKLDGAGSLEWGSLKCHGLFDHGRLVELHNAVLTNGVEITVLDESNLKNKKHSLVIQDDMVQEITRLNKTDQCKNHFEWVITRYANSDVSETMYKDGCRHGISFHFRKDGGIGLSEWIEGRQSFNYSLDSNGNTEISYINFWDIASTEIKTKSESVNSKSEGSEKLHILKGNFKRFFKPRDKAFWMSMEYDIQENKLMKDGCMYEGSTHMGVPDGNGKFIDEFGSSYQGNWKNGCPDGKGVYKNAISNEIYDGFWKEGMRFGFGKMLFTDGDLYVGEWKMDIICGRGVYTYIDKIVRKGLMFMVTGSNNIKKIFPSKVLNDLDVKFINPARSLYFYGSEDRNVYGSKYTNEEAFIQKNGFALPDYLLFDDIKEENYFGEIKNGWRDGYGYLTTRNGNLIEGEWIKGCILKDVTIPALKNGNHFEGSAMLTYLRDVESDDVVLVLNERFKFAYGHGRVKVKSPDGTCYTGEMAWGKSHGTGRLDKKNGDVYIGSFYNGYMHGKGNIRSAKGQFFEGEFWWDRRLVKSEPVVIEDGKTYSGEWAISGNFDDELETTFGRTTNKVNYSFHGFGKLTFPNGDCYVGQFENGEMNGIGTYTTVDGKSFDGEFYNGKFVHTGQIESVGSDGTRYLGNALMRRLLPTETPTHQSYDGTWTYHQAHGQGKIWGSTGSNYEGEYKENEMHGFGTLFYKTGEIFEVYFQNNKRHYHGKMTWTNGDVYEGEFSKDYADGWGVFKLKNGKEYGDCFEIQKLKAWVKHVPQSDGSFFTGWSNLDRLKSEPEEDTYLFENAWIYEKMGWFGHIEYPDSNYYTGVLENELPHGAGQMIYQNGAVYRGEFRSGEPAGYGKLVHPSKSFLKGIFEAGNIKNGEAMINFADGSKLKARVYQYSFERYQIFLEPSGEVISIDNHSGLKSFLEELIHNYVDWKKEIDSFPREKWDEDFYGVDYWSGENQKGLEEPEDQNNTVRESDANDSYHESQTYENGDDDQIEQPLEIDNSSTHKNNESSDRPSLRQENVIKETQMSGEINDGDSSGKGSQKFAKISIIENEIVTQDEIENRLLEQLYNDFCNRGFESYNRNLTQNGLFTEEQSPGSNNNQSRDKKVNYSQRNGSQLLSQENKRGKRDTLLSVVFNRKSKVGDQTIFKSCRTMSSRVKQQNELPEGKLHENSNETSKRKTVNFFFKQTSEFVLTDLKSDYVGDYKFDLFHGYGTLMLIDGSSYKGSFCENLFSGQGAFVLADKTIIEGEFEPVDNRGFFYKIKRKDGEVTELEFKFKF